MPKTKVFINNREASSKNSDEKSVAAFPDPCFSPPGPPAGPVVIPYPNTAFAKDLKNGTSTVFIMGKMVAQEDKSFYATSTGNEAATESFPKGVMSNKIKGKAYFKSWSMNVSFQGRGVPRHLDIMTHNHGSECGNTVPCRNMGDASKHVTYSIGFYIVKAKTDTPYMRIKYRLIKENATIVGNTDALNSVLTKINFGQTIYVDTDKPEKVVLEVESHINKNDWIKIGEAVTKKGKKEAVKIKVPCGHQDGAIKVAEYIVQEIKTNCASNYAESMRYYNDYETRMKEWEQLPLWQRIIIPCPEPMLIEALSIWTDRVAQNRPWDHKPRIRDNFNYYAVRRPMKLEKEKTIPADYKSYFHKYKTHDYFYDIWSNIHYGYLGMSCGFDESLLLDGAGLEQIGTDILGKEGPSRKTQTGALRDFDAISDNTAITLGISLYKQFGKFATSLNANVLLSQIELISSWDDSRVKHVCFDASNYEFTKE